jgi:hypothetical protein
MSTILTGTDIERIARGLIDRSLPKSEWTHAAHFAAALWVLRRVGPRAVSAMPPLIRAYNEATGVANTDTSGYHETITLASLRAASFWVGRRPDAPLDEVLAEMLATPIGRSDWMFKYWSRNTLFSVAARKSWTEPDLAPLPYAHI